MSTHRGNRKRPARRSRASSRVLPALEPLEVRRLLASYFVSSNDDSGSNTLRAAITSLDSTGGPSNTITFNLASGQQTIDLLSALPDITLPVDIEGSTEPGYAGTPLVVIDGASAGSGASGLALSSGSSGSIVQGLVIADFSTGDGIDIELTDDHVAGCDIGTSPSAPPPRPTASASRSGAAAARSAAPRPAPATSSRGTSATGSTSVPRA